MNEKPRQELHLFFASQNTRAVILYRATNSLYRLIGWDTNSDRFEPGQWLKPRVFEHDCALSPDGRHFLYAAMQKGTSDAFMAISKPPYFTAVAYFPNMDSYSVNGFFIDNTTLSFSRAATGGAEITLSCGLHIDRDEKYWQHLRTAPKRKNIPDEEIARIRAIIDERRGQLAALIDDYHCDGAKLLRKTSGKDNLLQDFSDMQFEAIRAPYDGVQTRVET